MEQKDELSCRLKSYFAGNSLTNSPRPEELIIVSRLLVNDDALYIPYRIRENIVVLLLVQALKGTEQAVYIAKNTGTAHAVASFLESNGVKVSLYTKYTFPLRHLTGSTVVVCTPRYVREIPCSSLGVVIDSSNREVEAVSKRRIYMFSRYRPYSCSLLPKSVQSKREFISKVKVVDCFESMGERIINEMLEDYVSVEKPSNGDEIIATGRLLGARYAMSCVHNKELIESLGLFETESSLFSELRTQLAFFTVNSEKRVTIVTRDDTEGTVLCKELSKSVKCVLISRNSDPVVDNDAIVVTSVPRNEDGVFIVYDSWRKHGDRILSLDKRVEIVVLTCRKKIYSQIRRRLCSDKKAKSDLDSMTRLETTTKARLLEIDAVRRSIKTEKTTTACKTLSVKVKKALGCLDVPYSARHFSDSTLLSFPVFENTNYTALFSHAYKRFSTPLSLMKSSIKKEKCGELKGDVMQFGTLVSENDFVSRYRVSSFTFHAEEKAHITFTQGCEYKLELCEIKRVLFYVDKSYTSVLFYYNYPVLYYRNGVWLRSVSVYFMRNTYAVKLGFELTILEQNALLQWLLSVFDVVFVRENVVSPKNVLNLETIRNEDWVRTLTFDKAYELESVLTRHARIIHMRAPLSLFMPTTDYFSLEKIINSLSNELFPNLEVLEVQRHKNPQTVKTLFVTPTRTIVGDPAPVPKNRIISSFGPENFVRVKFCGENASRIWNGAEMKPIFRKFKRFFMNGIELCSHTIHFVAASASQMKENSFWFVYNHHPETIHSYMGDFSTIHNVGKRLIRIGQLFSSSYYSLPIERYAETYDKTTKDGTYCFTDGVGMMPRWFAESVFTLLNLRTVPSAVQIRFGGYKGVLSLNEEVDLPTFRPSMHKFTSEIDTVEIVGYNTYIPCFLNRQVINILSSLGIKDSVFEELQEEMIERMCSIVLEESSSYPLNSYISALPVVERYTKRGLKKSEGLFKLVRTAYVYSQFYSLALKCRIEVPKGAVLMGIADEYGVLKSNEVFVCVKGVAVQERVVVMKNPCLDRGDARVLTAVSRPELSHLSDVIVFSCVGRRPIPSTCSGSDLDGDLYFVTWEERLVPETDSEPLPYTSEEIVQDQVVTKEAICDFIINFMQNNDVGWISNAHLAYVDLYGMNNDRCRLYAELFSRAVDFPKTGQRVVSSVEAPQLYPDYMEKDERRTYRSESILGRLYRRVKAIKEITPFVSFSFKKEIDLPGNAYTDYVVFLCLRFKSSVHELCLRQKLNDEVVLLVHCLFTSFGDKEIEHDEKKYTLSLLDEIVAEHILKYDSLPAEYQDVWHDVGCKYDSPLFAYIAKSRSGTSSHLFEESIYALYLNRRAVYYSFDEGLVVGTDKKETIADKNTVSWLSKHPFVLLLHFTFKLIFNSHASFSLKELKKFVETNAFVERETRRSPVLFKISSNDSQEKSSEHLEHDTKSHHNRQKKSDARLGHGTKNRQTVQCSTCGTACFSTSNTEAQSDCIDCFFLKKPKCKIRKQMMSYLRTKKETKRSLILKILFSTTINELLCGVEKKSGMGYKVLVLCTSTSSLSEKVKMAQTRTSWRLSSDSTEVCYTKVVSEYLVSKMFLLSRTSVSSNKIVFKVMFGTAFFTLREKSRECEVPLQKLSKIAQERTQKGSSLIFKPRYVDLLRYLEKTSEKTVRYKIECLCDEKSFCAHYDANMRLLGICIDKEVWIKVHVLDDAVGLCLSAATATFYTHTNKEFYNEEQRATQEIEAFLGQKHLNDVVEGLVSFSDRRVNPLVVKIKREEFQLYKFDGNANFTVEVCVKSKFSLDDLSLESKQTYTRLVLEGCTTDFSDTMFCKEVSTNLLGLSERIRLFAQKTQEDRDDE